jgi:hypothetical protein
MRDIVVGCITNYTFDKIAPWVNSLERSGFDGLKIMICYNIGYDVVEELTKRGFTVFGFKRNDAARKLEYKPDFNICLERFSHIAYFFNKLENKEQYRYVISTDVKDVIFQTNPSTWLEENIGDKKLNVASESLKYKDEPWGDHNLLQSFGPLIHERNRENTIYNAGTIAGEFKHFVDLCDNIFLSCGGAPQNVPGGGGPDQAALNVLLQLKPYKDITNFATSESGYAAQLGTTADPSKIDSFMPVLLEPTPIIEDGIVKTSTGVPFAIVHQYDRVPEWRKIIEDKYK